jgi:hypothetical protein
MQSVRIALVCYRYIVVPATVITGIASFLLVQSGTSGFLAVVLWLKAITTGLLLVYVHLFRLGELYFFNNLGYSNLTIYLAMGAVEVAITSVCFAVALQMI